jgi:hypothetical protein
LYSTSTVLTIYMPHWTGLQIDCFELNSTKRSIRHPAEHILS